MGYFFHTKISAKRGRCLSSENESILVSGQNRVGGDRTTSVWCSLMSMNASFHRLCCMGSRIRKLIPSSWPPSYLPSKDRVLRMP